MAKKPEKTTPTTKMTSQQKVRLAGIKANNKVDGLMDAADGRDSRMARDGGTNRRLRQ